MAEVSALPPRRPVTYRLEPGDSVQSPSSVPHRYANRPRSAPRAAARPPDPVISAATRSAASRPWA